MQGLWLLSLFCVSALRVQVTVSPIEKIIQLLGDLEGKIIKDGEAQQIAYEEYADWCKDSSKDTIFAIKTGKGDAERAAAAVADAAAQISALTTKIDELSTSSATNSADLKAATGIRTAEKADYDKADAELAETVSMLRRAHGIIEKAMSGGSFIQGNVANNIVAALQEIIAAVGVSTEDKAKLQSLMQTDSDDMQPGGAPAPDAYKSQSGGILAALEDMLEKSEAQRADGQKAEMNGAFNFKMLKQSLEKSVADQEKELSEAKKGKAGEEEAQAEAQGKLESTNTEIADDQKKLKDMQHECMTRAEEHEVSQKERADELNALATAKKLINEKTGGAADRTYSLMQVKTTTQSKLQLKLKEQKDAVIALLQKVAKQNSATELAQLAMRIRSVESMGSDPFAKVKTMIQEMVEKLIAEAAKEAGKKEFCDKEMSETKAKMEDKQGEVDDLNTKIDTATAKIAKLAESTATLQSELADIANEQKLALEMRDSEKANWVGAKADFEQGLEGIQMALQVLRDYYAEKTDDAALIQTSDLDSAMASATKETGAASGIIGMLEVAESDFSKMLAEGSATESEAQKLYDETSQDNKVTIAAKEMEVKYQTKDSKETKAFLEETKGDLGTSQTELDAVLEYWEKLQPQCVAKPEPYAERKKRRENEIAGLKQALEILENETAGSAFLAIREQ